MRHEPDDEALGIYVGTMSTHEVLTVLDEHTPGEWVAILRNSDGDPTWSGHGWSWRLDGNSPTFVIGKTEQGASNPAVYLVRHSCSSSTPTRRSSVSATATAAG